jgi:hypothetical protein
MVSAGSARSLDASTVAALPHLLAPSAAYLARMHKVTAEGVWGDFCDNGAIELCWKSHSAAAPPAAAAATAAAPSRLQETEHAALIAAMEAAERHLKNRKSTKALS